MIDTRQLWRGAEVAFWLGAAGLAWLILARITARISERAGRVAGIPPR